MFGAGETHVLAQNFQQSLVDLRGDFFGFPVDPELRILLAVSAFLLFLMPFRPGRLVGTLRLCGVIA
jgi:hypothetical protein